MMPKGMSYEEAFGKPEDKPKKGMSYEEAFGKPSTAGEGFASVKAGLRGLGQGALFGFGDEALAAAKAAFDDEKSYRQLLEEERAEVERAAEEHPGSYYTGMGTGIVGGAALGGALGAAAGVGKAATLGAQAKRAAALGGLTGLGASEAHPTKEPVKLAGDVALGAGTGAAFQGLLGKGGEVLKKLPLPSRQAVTKAARDKAAERAIKATTGQGLEKMRSIAKTTKHGGSRTKALENLRRVGSDILEEVDESGKPLLKFARTSAESAKGVEAARAKYGALLGKVETQLDEFFPEGSVRGENIANKLRKYAEEIPPVGQGPTRAQKIIDVADQFDEAGTLTFKKAVEYKNQFKYKPADADLLVSDQDVTNRIRSIIGGEMDEVVDKTASAIDSELARRGSAAATQVTMGPKGMPVPAAKGQPPINAEEAAKVRDLLGQYQTYKGKYGAFKEIEPASVERYLRDLSNRAVSPTDYYVGGTAAMVSGEPTTAALVAGLWALANQAARGRGSAVTATTLRALAKAAENPGFAQKFGPALLKASQRGPAAVAAAHAALSARNSDYAKQFTGENE